MTRSLFKSSIMKNVLTKQMTPSGCVSKPCFKWNNKFFSSSLCNLENEIWGLQRSFKGYDDCGFASCFITLGKKVRHLLLHLIWSNN